MIGLCIHFHWFFARSVLIKLRVCLGGLRMTYLQPRGLFILLEQLSLLDGGSKKLVRCDSFTYHYLPDDQVLFRSIDVELFVNIVHILYFFADFLDAAEGL